MYDPAGPVKQVLRPARKVKRPQSQGKGSRQASPRGVEADGRPGYSAEVVVRIPNPRNQYVYGVRSTGRLVSKYEALMSLAAEQQIPFANLGMMRTRARQLGSSSMHMYGTPRVHAAVKCHLILTGTRLGFLFLLLLVQPPAKPASWASHKAPSFGDYVLHFSRLARITWLEDRRLLPPSF
jgi:hypothetical protein